MVQTKQSRNPKRTPVRVAAVIPARGGKQSIPYKNLLRVGGKTLLAWAIEIAFQAQDIDVVVVSTEDKKIAKEAEKLGALVAPRPKRYSQPKSGDAGFYHHAVAWMEEEFGWKPELLINLRPTSPLRFASDIDAMVAYMRKSGADGLKSVIPSPLHPYKMWEMQGRGEVGSAGKLVSLYQHDFKKKHGPDQPRQEIQKRFPVFFQDGQVDITRRKFIVRPESLKYDNVWGENVHGYVLDPRSSVDIDTPEDLREAARVYRTMVRERGKKKSATR